MYAHDIPTQKESQQIAQAFTRKDHVMPVLWFELPQTEKRLASLPTSSL